MPKSDASDLRKSNGSTPRGRGRGRGGGSRGGRGGGPGSSGGYRGRGGRGGGRGRGGQGGPGGNFRGGYSGGSNPNYQAAVKLSKWLSMVLRHRATEMGVPIRDDGFVLIVDLQEKGGMKASFEDIQQLIESSKFQRFQLVQEDSNWMIRALEGHSIPTVDSSKIITPESNNDGENKAEPL